MGSDGSFRSYDSEVEDEEDEDSTDVFEDETDTDLSSLGDASEMDECEDGMNTALGSLGDASNVDDSQTEKDSGLNIPNSAFETDRDHDDDNAGEQIEKIPWLQSLKISMPTAESANPKRVGHCYAMLIDRDPIRADFYHSMEKATPCTASLAFVLFDRWGCLKNEHRKHPVKKGTGVWGSELDKGGILLIELPRIDKEYLREDLARSLVQNIWATAQSTNSDCMFAMARVNYLKNGTVRDTREELACREVHSFDGRLLEVTENFWRAMGFRRIGCSSYFGLAKDSSHPSRSLSASEDYNPPLALRSSLSADDPEFTYLRVSHAGAVTDFQGSSPLNFPHGLYKRLSNIAIIQADDSKTLDLLKAWLSMHSERDPVWWSVDRHHNNIMHILARDQKFKTLLWLLEKRFANELQLAKNLEGDTPLDALETCLEKNRTLRYLGSITIPTSDIFVGFLPIQMKCLLLLKGTTLPPKMLQSARLKFGCDCGRCIAGFMSPRNSFALEAQGRRLFSLLSRDLEIMSADEWCKRQDYLFSHLLRSVRSDLINLHLRQAFTKLFRSVALALHCKMLPTTRNMLQCTKNESPPYTQDFLQHGGTVAAVVLACFDRAIERDIFLGNGKHHRRWHEYIKKFPICRNDGEFIFARRQYRRYEALPEGEGPPGGMRDPGAISIA